MRQALTGIEPGGGADDPEIDTAWGEPGLTPAERVFGWNALEVLAFETGNSKIPVNAVPPRRALSCNCVMSSARMARIF